jgi:hypothetical protein
MPKQPFLKAQERILKILTFSDFYGGLNKNELLSASSVF